MRKSLVNKVRVCTIDDSQSNQIYYTEFELLRNAMYTDPNDQSVWMYHRWLVGTGTV